MAAFIWRVIIAIVAFVFVWALIPPVLGLLGLTPSGDVMQILRLCTAALAVLYIIAGPIPPQLRVP